MQIGIDNLLIAGIGTDVGKTIVSAIIVKMLGKNYWKPISCGPSTDRDSCQVQKLVADPNLTCYKEAYHFSNPLSPHHAASLEGIHPLPCNVIPPKSEKGVVIESVGGVLVPFNDELLVTDLFCQWDLPWILVSRHYVGSINHTLLTVEALQKRNASILGLVFNGAKNPHTESFITNYSGLPVLGRVEEHPLIDVTTIERYSQQWKQQAFWKHHLCPTHNPIPSGTLTHKL